METEIFKSALLSLRDKLSACQYSEKSMLAMGINPWTVSVDLLPLLGCKVKGRTPLNILISLFILGMRVNHKTVKQVFTPTQIEALTALGILSAQSEKEGTVSLVKISPYKGFYFISDFIARTSAVDRMKKDRIGHNRVYPPGPDSISLADAAVEGRFDSGLDLCTGCGIQAILASRKSRRVVGVDVNPRAVKFANMNLALNDIANVEFRLGDLYSPVGSERFDYIVSNPPFVMCWKKSARFRDGGREGDAVFNRILSGLFSHLREGGYCQIITYLGEFSHKSCPELFEQWSRKNRFDSILLILEEFGPVELARGQYRNSLDDFKKYRLEAVKYIKHLEKVSLKKVRYCLIGIKNNSTAGFKRYEPHVLRLFKPLNIINRHYSKERRNNGKRKEAEMDKAVA